jgi:hypothetical protein
MRLSLLCKRSIIYLGIYPRLLKPFILEFASGPSEPVRQERYAYHILREKASIILN